MDKLKEWLFSIMICALFLTWIVIAGYGIYQESEKNDEMGSYIGCQIIVGNDTLVVLNKSYWNESLQLSNGRDIDFDLAKKLVIKR